MNTRTTTADMRLMRRLPVHPIDTAVCPYDAIPLDWTIGGKKMHGLPATLKRTMKREVVDTNLTRYTYTGLCETCGLLVTVIHNEYRDYPVSEWIATFENTGDADTPILSDVTLGGTIAGDFTAFEHGNGDTLRPDGYHWFTDDLQDAPLTIHPVDGTSCNGAFPYMKLHFADSVVRAAVGWTGMWKATAARTENGVAYSCGQLRCHMTIHPGEVMRTPMLTLMISEGNDTRSMNLWRRWYMAHILPRENGKPIPPTMCLHLFEQDGKPEFTGATEEKQVEALETYVKRGLTPDIWWVDAGWYKCDYVWDFVGGWKPDAARFPNGLAPIGAACDKVGARFLLWFEPERVMQGTELYNEHPEWILSPTDTPDENTRYLFNLGDKAACDWMIERVDSIIKEGGVKIYRQDFNFHPRPHWERAEAEDRIGAVENLHIQGYLRYWDTLIERNPGLWMDSCASGGRRNDLDTMRRAVTLHYTDIGYGAHEIKQIQHRQMHEWVPYFRAHNMAWDRDFVENTLGEAWRPNDEFSFQNAMVPSVTYMTRYDAPEDEMERTRAAEKIWRRIAGLTLDGDFYPLSECRQSTADWYAVQFDDADAGCGYVQFIRNIHAEDESLTVQLHVIPGKTYVFENTTTGETFEKTADECATFTMALPVRTGVVLAYTTK